ncbi:MAG: dihydrodipicolinate synthase [Mycobacterium sp.]|jgi:4-hydroxy-tetrahydrodipicolinate synthase|nr:dihydrodipicolinate synthase [Mycobacterium sp.]
MLVAMVTPFTADGGLDVAGAQKLAAHLIEQGCDGIVVSGTTGESPTTSDAEKEQLLRAVLEAADGRAVVLAGVGSNDTAHSVEQAVMAEKVGAGGALVVTPYYNRPPQAGIQAHFTAIADATELPVLLYDIPVRTGAPIATETLLRLAEHPRIVAVKDAKGDLLASSLVLAQTDLAYYSGEDALNLPLLSIGAAGFVSVVGHVFTPQLVALLKAFDAGDTQRAIELHQQLLPAYVGFFRTQGVITTKAALRLLGLPGGPVRLPLIDATSEQIDVLRADCAAAGLELSI